MSTPSDARRRASWLWLFTGLFLLRVLGQALVVTSAPRWLPPNEQWFSGLLPYPYLLPSQILILLGMVAVAQAVRTGRGRLARPRPRFGRWLRWFSYVYWAGMALRYVVSRLAHPEWGLAGHTIPIVFHCVLAAFLFTYARHLEHQAAEHDGAAPSGN